MRKPTTQEGHFVPCMHVHKKLPFRQHTLSGPTRAQIDSYIFLLARSVDRDNNKQGSMQDAAAQDQPRLILKTHHSGRSIFHGRNSKEAQSQSKIFIPRFWLTV